MGFIIFMVLGMTVSSQIDTVVVYPNQVIVLRSAQVTISQPQELVFPALPGGLVDNSVRVRAPGLRIGEVQIKKGYLAEPTPEVQLLEKKVQALEDSWKILEDEGAVLKAKEDFLNSVKLGAPEIISKELQQGRVAPESWRGALGFLAEELSRIKARQLKLKREQEGVNKRLEAARQELNSARAVAENRKELRFSVDGEPGSYRITFSYALPYAAKWIPYYELRADPGKGTVSLNYYARLSQRTGEDWKDVKVILSTSTPSPAITPPEPQPWYLYLIEETYRAKPMPAPGVAEEALLEMRKDETEFAGAPTEVSSVETGVSLQYLIPGKVSLKSGEEARKFSLDQVSLPAEFEFYTLPRVREQAFLTGRLMNSTEFVFMAGEGNTYVGDEFTGSVLVPAWAPQESVVIGFGVDERVKVKHELVKTFKSRVGLVGKTERIQFVYRTTVENYHPKPMRFKIIEQVPVSQQKEIKVAVTKIEPKFTDRDEIKGLYIYEKEVSKGERFEINLEYQVEYPAGQRVGGLY